MYTTLGGSCRIVSHDGQIGMDNLPFMTPKLVGRRFEGHAIPLELLRDLAVLEEMVIEVAKWRYLKDNLGRKRTPSGFTEDVSLRLMSIEEGSAIAAIGIYLGTANLLPPPKYAYFEQARESIVGAISAVDSGRAATDYLPPKVLAYFDRFGRSLREGESIEFPTGIPNAPARLNKETRRRLILASEVKEVTEEIHLSGKIHAANQDAMVFHITLADGSKVQGPITAQHYDTIKEAFNGFLQGMRVRFDGVGKFNRSEKLQSIQTIEHIMIDPLDIPSRLEELKTLQDGWLDGLGHAPSANGLDWLAKTFNDYYPIALPLPYVYPVAEGGVQLEWSITTVEASLEIDLKDHSAQWHALDLESDKEESRRLKLDEPEGWIWLVERLEGLNGTKA